MKKLLSILLTFVLLLGTTVCFAQTYSNSATGTTFSISNNWKTEEGDYSFSYKNNQGEYFWINIREILKNLGDSVEFYETACKEIFDDICNDQNLSSRLSEQNNGIYVSIKTESETKKYETYNGVKYLRFEKKYSASAARYSDTYFYSTVFFAVKNGFLNILYYETNYQTDNFSDIVNILNTIHYGKAIDIYVNGNLVKPDSYPEILNDRTLVPIRAVAEALEYDVKWYPSEQIIIISNEKEALYLQIKNYVMEKENLKTGVVEKFNLDVPPVIAADRTYLPLRAVGEALNCDVTWDGATRTIQINSK